MDPGAAATSPARIADPEALRAALEVDDLESVSLKLNEISQLLWLPEGLDKGEINARLARAIELYESLAPADGAEVMLAQQMVGTHHAAMECLRRAALQGQTFEGRDMALKHATKLMALYEKQMSALNKSRGKGQQKVTVEHVHVEAGGQAIVCNVEAGARTAPTRARGEEETPQRLEDNPDLPVDLTQRSKARRGRS